MTSPVATNLAHEVEERLVRYVQIDTTSDETATTVPSTPGQMVLQQLLAEELRQERLARTLPRTTFVIEAATPAEAQRKLAIVAGDADADRYRIWSVTK